MQVAAVKPEPSATEPQSASEALVNAQRRLFLPVDDLPPVLFERGEGSYLFDNHGRGYIDLGAGLGVNVLGYANPAISRVLQDQAARLIHLGSEHMCAQSILLAQELEAATGFDNVFFSNSGAEANEAALKIARNYHQADRNGDRSQIIAFSGSFHGRTMFNISAAGNAAHCAGFGPLVPGVTQVAWDPQALAGSVSEQTAVVLVETIQTRNGVRAISDSMIDAINQLRRTYGFLVVVDEVQTGTMRCGSMLDHRRRGLNADVVTLGKGLGGGLPIGATLTTKAIGARMRRGQHGSTFGGGPLVTAVAAAVLKAVRTPAMVQRIGAAGARLRGLLAERYGDEAVTGSGLMAGLRLPPDLVGASGLVERLALEAGVIVRTSGPDALRFTPPFTLGDDEMITGLDRLADAITRAGSSIAEQRGSA